MRNLSIILVLIVVMIIGCSAQPTVEYDANSAVPVSLVEELQFSDTSELSIEECVARFFDVTEPITVIEGDVLPADFAVYIDLDEIYISWEDFEMVALCVKGNWGVFRTTGSVEIPIEAKAWSITVD